MKMRPIWQRAWNGPLVGVAVVALVVFLALPAIQQAREAARRTQSKNDLKAIGLALSSYHDTFGMFPPGGVFGSDGKPFHGWMSSITPFIDASPWYNGVNFQIPWDHPRQIEHFQRGFTQTYLNPSLSVSCGDDGIMRVHYAGSDVIFYHNSSTRHSDLTSGASQTLCVGDAQDLFEPVGYAFNWRSAALGLNTVPAGFGCKVRPVTHMLMVDGGVRAFSHATDASVFTSLRGVNAKWEIAPGDVSKPKEPYRVSPPLVCLWVEPHSCSSLLGVEDDSGQLVRAWFFNSPANWHGEPFSTWDEQGKLLKPHSSLREVNVRNALSDRGLAVLKELPNLERVKL